MLGHLSTVFSVPNWNPEHCNPLSGQPETIWKGVNHCNRLDIPARNGAPRDLNMKSALSDNFDMWSKADNGSCIPHGRSIILELVNDNLP